MYINTAGHCFFFDIVVVFCRHKLLNLLPTLPQSYSIILREIYHVCTTINYRITFPSIYLDLNPKLEIDLLFTSFLPSSSPPTFFCRLNLLSAYLVLIPQSPSKDDALTLMQARKHASDKRVRKRLPLPLRSLPLSSYINTPHYRTPLPFVFMSMFS